MGEIKQINIKSRTIFFYNDMINLKDFESNLLKIDKKQYKGINKYYIEYIIPTKKIDECEIIYCVNPLYLQVNHANRYIEEKNGNKYLVFDSTDEKKNYFKKYTDVWSKIKSKMKAINGDKENDYGKDYKKIKFNSDNDLSSNRPLKLHVVTIMIISVFEEGPKFYQPIF